MAKIRELATKQGMRALRAVNSGAAEALADGRDTAPSDPVRMTFGIYFYHERQRDTTPIGKDTSA